LVIFVPEYRDQFNAGRGSMETGPIFISLRLALFTTIILFAVGLPLARFLVYSRKRWKIVIDIIATFPLVLPPTVFGFYALLLLSPNMPLGDFLLRTLGIRLVFTFPGMLFASCLYSLPFMLQPLKTGLQAVPGVLLESSYILGKSKSETFFKVVLPNMRASLVSGIMMTFSHTIGAFGVMLMVGGNIPGKTRLLSIAVYEKVEAMQFGTANKYALLLFGISTVSLIILHSFGWKKGNKQYGTD